MWTGVFRRLEKAALTYEECFGQPVVAVDVILKGLVGGRDFH